MAQRKKKKSGFKNTVLVAMLLVSGYFIYSTFNEIIETKTLKDSIKEIKEKEANLNETREELMAEKENLQNPEYLLRYAIGKYLVTKDDGEQVFKLPEE